MELSLNHGKQSRLDLANLITKMIEDSLKIMTNNKSFTWILFTYCSFSRKGSSVRVTLKGLDEVIVKYALQFNFQRTKSQTKYQALMVGLKLALEMEANVVKALNDS